jgi:hypothetical protein
MTIWRVRVACWITKASDPHSEHTMCIAFTTAKVIASYNKPRVESKRNNFVYLSCKKLKQKES